MGQDQLQAAIAWQYCQRSAQWALGQQTGNRMAGGILWALSNEPLDPRAKSRAEGRCLLSPSKNWQTSVRRFGRSSINKSTECAFNDLP
jgi:hypothetical protein